MFRRTQDTDQSESRFEYRAFTFFGSPFQDASSTTFIYDSMCSVLQPQKASFLVWALPVSLAATQGIDFFFLFLRVLRCFSSPGLPSDML